VTVGRAEQQGADAANASAHHQESDAAHARVGNQGEQGDESAVDAAEQSQRAILRAVRFDLALLRERDGRPHRGEKRFHPGLELGRLPSIPPRAAEKPRAADDQVGEDAEAKHHVRALDRGERRRGPDEPLVGVRAKERGEIPRDQRHHQANEHGGPA
jgi:hypothetical protein